MYQFKVCSSSTWGESDRLIKKYPALKDFGFKAVKHTRFSSNGKPYTCDEAFICVNDLDELFSLIEKTDRIIIESANPKYDGEDVDYKIEIYDDWRE